VTVVPLSACSFGWIGGSIHGVVLRPGLSCACGGNLTASKQQAIDNAGVWEGVYGAAVNAARCSSSSSPRYAAASMPPSTRRPPTTAGSSSTASPRAPMTPRSPTRSPASAPSRPATLSSTAPSADARGMTS
jgi:hypothetical protein